MAVTKVCGLRISPYHCKYDPSYFHGKQKKIEPTELPSPEKIADI